MLVNEKNSLNEQEIMQLRDNIVQIILNVGIPVIIYVKNKKLFQHVKEEILSLFWKKKDLFCCFSIWHITAISMAYYKINLVHF